MHLYSNFHLGYKLLIPSFIPPEFDIPLSHILLIETSVNLNSQDDWKLPNLFYFPLRTTLCSNIHSYSHSPAILSCVE